MSKRDEGRRLPSWFPEVFEDKQVKGDWRVEVVDFDGAVDVVIFSGPHAEVLAKKYHSSLPHVRRMSVKLVKI